MKISSRLAVVLLCLLASTATAFYQSMTPELVQAANAFLASLNPQQLNLAKLDFSSDRRLNLKYTPGPRVGLPLRAMEKHQRDLAYAMMAATLSQRGFIKATTIMSLEPILRQLEAGLNNGIDRDPELYYFSIFGEPSTTGTWGWKAEGHHVSVNIAIRGGVVVGSTPTFFGSNPAEVKEGPRKGLRVLAQEEDLARALLMALDAGQKKAAIIQTVAPREILTAENREPKIGAPVGLPVPRMNPKQVEMLTALLQEYAYRMSPDIAEITMNDVRKAGIDKIFFAWAGSEKRGDPHYYRVQGPTFVVEYDNTQNNANHIHSVWRDLGNDFGVDALREHYRTAHVQ
jgi:hypothetical protein